MNVVESRGECPRWHGGAVAEPIVRHVGSWRFVIRLRVEKKVFVQVESRRRVQSTQDHAGSPRMWLIDGVHISSNTRAMGGLSLEELLVDTAVATDHVVKNGRNISFEATLRGS